MRESPRFAPARFIVFPCTADMETACCRCSARMLSVYAMRGAAGWRRRSRENRWMFGPAPERTLNIRVVFLHAWNATEIPEREIRMINTY